MGEIKLNWIELSLPRVALIGSTLSTIFETTKLDNSLQIFSTFRKYMPWVSRYLTWKNSVASVSFLLTYCFVPPYLLFRSSLLIVSFLLTYCFVPPYLLFRFLLTYCFVPPYLLFRSSLLIVSFLLTYCFVPPYLFFKKVQTVRHSHCSRSSSKNFRIECLTVKQTNQK